MELLRTGNRIHTVFTVYVFVGYDRACRILTTTKLSMTPTASAKTDVNTGSQNWHILDAAVAVMLGFAAVITVSIVYRRKRRQMTAAHDEGLLFV